MITITRNSIAAAVLLTSASLLAGTGALAQTATNLNCKGCVGKKDLGKNAVTTKAIRKNAIKAAKIKDKAITAAKLGNGATPAGYARNGKDGESVDLSTTPAIVVSVALKAPAAGHAVVVGEGALEFNGNGNNAGCSLGSDAAYDTTIAGIAAGDNNLENEYAHVSRTRILPVTAGVNTFNFICKAQNGEAVRIFNPQISALFVPGAY
jgi:hypothetical protein